MPIEGFYIYSVADLGLSSEFDFFFSSAAATVGGAPDVLTLSDDDPDFEDEGSGAATQLLDVALSVDGSAVAAAGDVVQNVGQSVLTNLTSGETGLLVLVQINGAVVGFASTITLDIGDALDLGPWLGSPKTIPYGDLTTVPACFARGTRILTAQGELPVERLKLGDRVITKDHGAQELVWIGARKALGTGRLAPVRFCKGAMGNGRALTVSPMHRMLVSGWKAELLFGETEVLMPAIELVNGDTVFQAVVPEVEYFHLLFARHEIIFAEGCPSESLDPLKEAVGRFGHEAQAEILSLFPELAYKRRAEARVTVLATEAALWRSF